MGQITDHTSRTILIPLAASARKKLIHKPPSNNNIYNRSEEVYTQKGLVED